jgi:hypothetical protein
MKKLKFTEAQTGLFYQAVGDGNNQACLQGKHRRGWKHLQ